jgi:RimJ/RimL family protein N-acetyltransferase
MATVVASHSCTFTLKAATMQSTITTQRLSLTLVQPADASFMMELVNTPGWLQFIGDRNVHSSEEAAVYINRLLNTPDLFYWVIRTHSNNTPVGVVSFLKRTYLDYFDIGFALLPQCKGNGYAYEAATAVLKMALSNPAHPVVLATTMPNNMASIQLLTKLGLQYEKVILQNDEALLVYKIAAA